MDNLFGMETVDEIAAFILEKAKNEKVAVTLTIEPTRHELRVEPWENVVMSCPYRNTCDDGR